MNMVEKAAQAIHEQEPMSWCAGDPWDELKAGCTSAVEQYTRMARAVIQSMREPTEEMKTDPDGLDRWSWNCNTCGGPKENWQIMIDAALAK